MPPPPTLNLPEETIDDLLYFSRTASLTDLQTTISSLLTSPTSSPSSILAILSTAIDPETGNTCLHYAAANGHKDVVEWILSCLPFISEGNENRNGNRTDGQNGDFASEESDGRSILKNGKARADAHTPTAAILDARNAAGNTPLHWASLNGQIEVVRLLVDAGADLSVRSMGGRDALEEAVGAERWDVVGWLSSRVDEGGEGGNAEDQEDQDEKGVRGKDKEDDLDVEGEMNGTEEIGDDGNGGGGVSIRETGQMEGAQDDDGVTESTKELRLDEGKGG